GSVGSGSPARLALATTSGPGISRNVSSTAGCSGTHKLTPDGETTACCVDLGSSASAPARPLVGNTIVTGPGKQRSTNRRPTWLILGTYRRSSASVRTASEQSDASLSPATQPFAFTSRATDASFSAWAAMA